MKDIRIILANGTILDTRDNEIVRIFKQQNKSLLSSLKALSDQVKGDVNLTEFIRHKYRIKNTMGYGVNALIDYEDPIDILSHLIIGSEGTLGFISEINL